MAVQSRVRVLLLDPVRHRREQVARFLGPRYDVAEAGTPKEALAAATAAPPDVVVATLRQIEDNGLVACKAIRNAAGPDAFMLVHGPAETTPNRDLRQHLERTHRVNTWSPSALSPSVVDVMVWNHLLERRRQSEGPPPSWWTRFRTVSVTDAWRWVLRVVGLG